MAQLQASSGARVPPPQQLRLGCAPLVVSLGNHSNISAARLRSLVCRAETRTNALQESLRPVGVHSPQENISGAADSSIPRPNQTVNGQSSRDPVLSWAARLVDGNPFLRDTISGPMMMAASSYWLAQCIYVAVKLGIPDLMARSDKALTVREIAAKVGAHPQTLYRLMRSLSGQGPIPGVFIEVFPPPRAEDLPFPLSQVANLLSTAKNIAPEIISQAIPEQLPFQLPAGLWRSVDADDNQVIEADLDRKYALTPLGAVFRKDMEGGIRDVTLMSGQEMYQAWGALEHSVRTGESAFSVAHGDGLWDFYAARPDAAATFNASMSNLSTLHTSPGSACAEFDFSFGGRATTICDIGGGQGKMLTFVLDRFPSMHGILYDQQGVVSSLNDNCYLTEKGYLNTTDASLSRVTLAAGSFFDKDSVPKGCDVYIMKHIIHDWDDDNAAVILDNISNAMHADSRLLLVEVVVPEENTYNPFSSEFTSYFDLHMLVAVGGAERRPSEFRRILELSGLELVRIHKGTGPGKAMCVVEAKIKL